MKKFTSVLSGVSVAIMLSMSSWGKETLELPAYPNAKIADSFYGEKQHHLVVGSAMKKVNGVVKADEEVYLDGVLDRKLFLLPDEGSHFTAYAFYHDYFRAKGVKPVYECQRFHCGDSNFWANNVFAIPTLYGLDKEQGYFLGEAQVDGKLSYITVYTIRRGNKRSYALVDIFTTEKAPQSVLTTAEKAREISFSNALTQPQIKQIHAFLSNHIEEGDKPQDVLFFVTTKPSASLAHFDQSELKVKELIIKIKEIILATGINESHFRVRYAGINPAQKREYQLSIHFL